MKAEFEKGFVQANLKNFRQFNLAFPEFEKGYALRSQLTWTHYRLTRWVVKYSVINDIPQLFAAKYKLYLPSEEKLIAEIEREKLLLNLKNDVL